MQNNVELNLNHLNNINDFNHLTDIDPDRNIVNLQPNCFNVDPRNLLQIPLADKIFFSLMSLNICSLISNFLNLQLELTDRKKEKDFLKFRLKAFDITMSTYIS